MLADGDAAMWVHPQTSIGNNVRLIFYRDCDTSRADLQFRKLPTGGDGFLFQSVRAKSLRPADTPCTFVLLLLRRCSHASNAAGV